MRFRLGWCSSANIRLKTILEQKGKHKTYSNVKIQEGVLSVLDSVEIFCIKWSNSKEVGKDAFDIMFKR